MIRNLKTGTISPQFHVVYDDHFTTLPTRSSDKDTKLPESWRALLLEFARERSDFGPEDEDLLPNLANKKRN